MRASPGLDDIAASLLLTLFPSSALYRAPGALTRLLLTLRGRRQQLERLRGLLFDLVERPE
ncbi:MAG TPA: hypothetical protein VFD39_06655, partial [Trueperaceae bacterium]|nr:hypothetical protein [Trueperaceae bacterium]